MLFGHHWNPAPTNRKKITFLLNCYCLNKVDIFIENFKEIWEEQLFIASCFMA